MRKWMGGRAGRRSIGRWLTPGLDPRVSLLGCRTAPTPARARPSCPRSAMGPGSARFPLTPAARRWPACPPREASPAPRFSLPSHEIKGALSRFLDYLRTENQLQEVPVQLQLTLRLTPLLGSAVVTVL